MAHVAGLRAVADSTRTFFSAAGFTLARQYLGLVTAGNFPRRCRYGHADRLDRGRPACHWRVTGRCHVIVVLLYVPVSARDRRRELSVAGVAVAGAQYHRL